MSSNAAGYVRIHSCGLGSTTITAQATGYNNDTSNVTVEPSGFCIHSPVAINTTTSTANTTVYIRSTLA